MCRARQAVLAASPPEPGLPSAAELGGLAIGVAIIGGVITVGGAVFRGVRGFIRDRKEDAAARALGPGMRQRLYRMRAWRQSLNDGESGKWRAEGTAGRELRDFEGQATGPNWVLEEQLVDRQGLGPSVEAHEAIWVLDAEGRWQLVEARLDPGAPGLVVPPALARRLGFIDGRGRARLPSAAFAARVKQAAGPEGGDLAGGQPLGLVSFSIAGQRFGDLATLATEPKAPPCVVVPAQAIQLLAMRGVRFEG